MIPTWRPDPDYLETAVESVLRQFSAGDAVQIELVDDGSPDFDVIAFARRFGGGRVTAHRNERRLGLAGNWNACIARARQPWVHLLHQDDFVLDGFYTAMRRGIERAPQVGAAFAASWFADASGRRWAPRLVPVTEPGVLKDWVEHVFVRLSIQCSAMVVRRHVYEGLGGFDPGLSYALDWDMWKRIAARHPIWFEPEPLAAFRRHAASETSRQREAGAHVAEIFDSINRSANLLPSRMADDAVRRARRHYTVFTAEEALGVLRQPNGPATALGLLRTAARNTSLPVVAAAVGKVAVRSAWRRLHGQR